MEHDHVKEISSLRLYNQEWEVKTKEILHQIQQNDLVLEKKEFERNAQLMEMNHYINQQEE